MYRHALAIFFFFIETQKDHFYITKINQCHSTLHAFLLKFIFWFNSWTSGLFWRIPIPVMYDNIKCKWMGKLFLIEFYKFLNFLPNVSHYILRTFVFYLHVLVLLIICFNGKFYCISRNFSEDLILAFLGRLFSSLKLNIATKT